MLRTSCNTGAGKKWEAECRKWSGGALAAMCKACPANTRAVLPPWTSHLMLLRQLIEAGCHFGPNDLTMEEWLGLAELKAAIMQDATDAVKEKRRQDGPPAIAEPQSAHLVRIDRGR